MLGVLVRSAGYFVLGMLLATLLNEVLSYMTPLMTYPQGGTPVYVNWINAVNDNWPVIILIAIVFAIVARASVEAKLGGAA